MDAHGMLVRIVITDGNTADCTQAAKLIYGITAEYLLADKGYDSDEIVLQAESQGMIAVIPPRKKQKGSAGI
jgi:IS5 family transposase